MTLMLTPAEYGRVELLTELGGFANTSDAVRAAIEEMTTRLERKVEKDADRGALRGDPQP